MIHCFSFSWASLLNVKQFLLQNCTVRLEYFQMWPVLNKAHVKVMLGYFRNYRSNLILIMLMGQLHSMTVKTKIWQGSVLIYPHFMALTAVNRRGCMCESPSQCNHSVTFLLPINWLHILLFSPRIFSNMNNLVSDFHMTVGYLPAAILRGYSSFLVKATWRELNSTVLEVSDEWLKLHLLGHNQEGESVAIHSVSAYFLNVLYPLVIQIPTFPTWQPPQAPRVLSGNKTERRGRNHFIIFHWSWDLGISSIQCI